MQIQSLCRHLVFATSKYRVHSPFVFRLIREVLDNDRRYYAFEEIAALRKQLVRDQRVLERVDFGAGQTGRRESVSHIAKMAAASPGQGEMLFRLVEFLGSEYILELGTSLGIGTQYLAGPGRHQRLVTLEGDPAVAAIAAEHLGNQARIVQHVGPFRETLPPALQELERIDLVYIDGDHTEAGTLYSFRTCLAKAGPQTCFVLDDIHWSAGMERAWTAIRQDPSVSLSIDLYRCGLLFFRTEHREKEHFLLYP